MDIWLKESNSSSVLLCKDRYWHLSDTTNGQPNITLNGITEPVVWKMSLDDDSPWPQKL